MRFYNTVLIIFSVLLLSFSFDCESQIRNLNINNPTLPQKNKKVKKSILSISTILEDTLYAISIKKQHGWILPLQTVNKKEYKKYPQIYRFTKRNTAGNWCRVECITGRGDLKGKGFNTYIVRSELEKDSLANKDWTKKIFWTCRLDFISDPVGENVIQERAYNSSGNLVYSFSISPLNSNSSVFVGSYRDMYGLPAEMRNDKDFSYGTLVYLERDKWGNDSIVKFMDSKGYVKPNYSGVYCEQFIYDEFGRLLRSQSLDSNGELVNDNLGYCGMEYQYDKRHNKIKAIYMDADWTPSSINIGYNGIKEIYKYDDLSRLIEIKYIDQYDAPMENSLGTHKVVYEYNDFGDKTSTCGFNLLGKLSPYEEGKEYCKSIVNYSPEGNLIGTADYDREGAIVSSSNFSDYLSKVDKDDNTKDSSPNDKNDNVKITKYNDNSYKRETYSDDGGISNITYYDSNGHIDSLVLVPIKEYLYNVNRDERPFDNQYLSDLIDIEIEKDYKGNITRIFSYNPNYTYYLDALYEHGRLIEISGHTGRFTKTSRTDDLNAYGHLSRCGGTSWMRSYHLNISKTLSNKMSCYFGSDEFGEPNYVDSPDGRIYCYMYKSNTNNNVYVDEDNNPIDDFDALKDRCPKYLSIEVTDKKGYELGVEDNDIVLSINDYKINPFISDYDFSTLKSLLPVLTAGEKKNICLFHIDPVSLQTSVKTIEIDEGNVEDYGIRLHCMYATTRQHERIAAMNHEEMDNLFYDKIMSSKNKVVVISKSEFRDKSPYTMQNGKDAILLAAQINDFPLINWKYGDDEEKIEKIVALRNNVKDYVDTIPTITLYLTDDGKTIKTISTKESAIGCSFWHANLDDQDHLDMRNLSQSITFATRDDNFISSKNYKDLDDESKDKIFRYADVYHKAGFYEISFEIFQKLAKSECSKAEQVLARYYAYGLGVKKDLKLAEKLALISNDSGHSMCDIAESFIEENQNDKIVNLLKNIKKDERYFDMAQMYIGDGYLHNDTALALDYYIKALNINYSIAAHDLTYDLINRIRKIDSSPLMLDSIYSVGIKLFDDNKDKQAYHIFKALVDCEYYEALHYLSFQTLYGYGVRQDVDQATFLAKTFLEKENNAFGIINVAEFHLKKNEYNKAIKLLLPISQKGSYQLYADYYLGKIYSNPNYFEKNLQKSLQYTIKALSFSYYYDRYKEELPEVEEFLLSNKTLYTEVAKGLYYISLHYLNHDINDKSLDLLREINDIDPNFAEEKFISYYRTYYRAMHANGIPSIDEYNEFMENKRMVLYVPYDLGEDHELYKFKGQKLPIVSLNGWNNSQESIMNNIFDNISDENIIKIEVDSKIEELSISDSDVLKDYIYLETNK